MAVITSRNGQTMLDIAMQSAGSVEAVVSLSLLNNKSITDELAIGESITTVDVLNETVKLNFDTQGKSPSSRDEFDFSTPEEGIGFWAIEEDFIVS